MENFWTQAWNNPKARQFGSNMLSDLGYGLVNGQGFNGVMQSATQRTAEMQPQRDAYAVTQQAEAERQEAINATTEWLRNQASSNPFAAEMVGLVDAGALSPGQAFSQVAQMQSSGGSDDLMSVGGHIYDRGSGQWISPPETADNRQNVSLSGQWGRDAQGNPVYLQPTSTGDFLQSTVPQGVTLQGPFDTNADRAAGTAFGRNTGSAQFDLPAAQLMADQTLQAIADVRSNEAGMAEQFGNILGVPQQITPAWPGSPKANFQVAVGRLSNRAFMEAREMLRGGGQITDFESRKAESAITSLEDAMARGDQELFQRALDDFEAAVRDGLVKLQGQATVMPGYGGAQQSTPSPAGTTSTGLQWSIVP